MVQFIKQEAKEKAAEIKLKADEEYNIQKLRAVEDEKQKIRGDYERKEKQVEVQKRIAQSNEVRLGRMKTLKAREEAMQAVLAEAAAKLPSLTQGSGYATLLESLILEALIELCDQKVQVKGIASAAAITQKAMTPAVAKYKEWATKSQGAAWASTIEVTFDSTPLTSGCARPPADKTPARPPPPPRRRRSPAPPLPRAQDRRRRRLGLRRQDHADEHARVALDARVRDATARAAPRALRLGGAVRVAPARVPPRPDEAFCALAY